MKRLQSKGHGSIKKQAEVITEEEEDLLWQTAQLGDSNPQQLLNTMVFYCGLHFSLRSGKEHRQLRHTPCQIELVESPGQDPYLVYREDVSKNHPGGLRGRNIKPKVVFHHTNKQNTHRCFIRLFKKYRSLCPPNAQPDSFYLKPHHSPTPTCWFSRRPVGHHPLSNTVARLCKSAGIEGYKTNHSLRATSTSRLYQSGVDEQLVMERSGHRSIEGVRSYKRTSDEQRRALSDILNGVRKTAPVDLASPNSARDPSALPPTAPAPPPTTPRPSKAAYCPTHQFINCTFNITK